MSRNPKSCEFRHVHFKKCDAREIHKQFYCTENRKKIFPQHVTMMITRFFYRCLISLRQRPIFKSHVTNDSHLLNKGRTLSSWDILEAATMVSGLRLVPLLPMALSVKGTTRESLTLWLKLDCRPSHMTTSQCESICQSHSHFALKHPTT